MFKRDLLTPLNLSKIRRSISIRLRKRKRKSITKISRKDKEKIDQCTIGTEEM